MTPRRVRLYLAARRRLAQAIGLQQALFEGFWLGILDREHLHDVDKRAYDSWRSYHEEEYNRGGLNGWEARAVERHFRAARRLLVLAAGGGREVLALTKLGYHVDACECHPELVAFANRFLAEEGSPARVSLVSRDGLPPPPAVPYEGAIVGWGSYMLVQSRERRVALLSELRSRLVSRAPVLVSFFHRPRSSRPDRAIAGIANLLRRMRRRAPRVEPGDRLHPNYVHFFTRDEVAAELAQAGFELVHFDASEYGHAVALSAGVELPRAQVAPRAPSPAAAEPA